MFFLPDQLLPGDSAVFLIIPRGTNLANGATQASLSRARFKEKRGPGLAAGRLGRAKSINGYFIGRFNTATTSLAPANGEVSRRATIRIGKGCRPLAFAPPKTQVLKILFIAFPFASSSINLSR